MKMVADDFTIISLSFPISFPSTDVLFTPSWVNFTSRLFQFAVRETEEVVKIYKDIALSGRQIEKLHLSAYANF